MEGTLAGWSDVTGRDSGRGSTGVTSGVGAFLGAGAARRDDPFGVCAWLTRGTSPLVGLEGGMLSAGLVEEFEPRAVGLGVSVSRFAVWVVSALGVWSGAGTVAFFVEESCWVTWACRTCATQRRLKYTDPPNAHAARTSPAESGRSLRRGG